nr:hypothetical protein OG409_00485 [Streptomyces sp. NBC_00974]WSX54268.1 hypothetical protein OG409_38430 [Streptomyces sp. NBC_00974]
MKPAVPFTALEIEATAHLAEGMTVKAIAVLLGRSEETVKSRIELARTRVGARTAASLVDAAYRYGALAQPDLEPCLFEVTVTQRRGLELLAEGCLGPEAAHKLGISHAAFRGEMRCLKILSRAVNHAHLVHRGWELRLLSGREPG